MCPTPGRRIPSSYRGVTGFLVRKLVSTRERKRVVQLLTVVQSIDAAAKGDLVGKDDTSIDGQQTARKPPTNRVSQKVDLLACIGLGPETHAPEQEWPLVGLAGVRMTTSQLTVVPEHCALQLEPFLQEGHRLDFTLLPFATR